MGLNGSTGPGKPRITVCHAFQFSRNELIDEHTCTVHMLEKEV